MEFRIKHAGRCCEAVTEKGNEISFLITPDSKITISDSDDHDYSYIVLNCSFEPTSPMADMLDSSKIIEVKGIKRIPMSYSIRIKPKFGYSLEKLKDVLFDLCQKFDL